MGRPGRKHGWTGGWREELQSSRELQCSYASCYQCTDSSVFIGPGLRAHRRNHGKQRLAFLWWKTQFNVDNTFLFQPLFRGKSGVISTLQADILKVYMVYINVNRAHFGTVSALCGFWTQETSDSIKQCYGYFSALRSMSLWELNIVFVTHCAKEVTIENPHVH